jgi:hypothetical protein
MVTQYTYVTNYAHKKNTSSHQSHVNSEMLNSIIRRPHTPNFTQTVQYMWKVLTEIQVHPLPV